MYIIVQFNISGMSDLWLLSGWVNICTLYSMYLFIKCIAKLFLKLMLFFLIHTMTARSPVVVVHLVTHTK